MRLGEYSQAAAPSAGGREYDAAPVAADKPEGSLPDNLDGEAAALKSMGFSKPLLATLGEKARRNSSSIEC